MRQISRRFVLQVAATLTGSSLVGTVFVRGAQAQDASPEPSDSWASLGLPEITLKATASAFEGAPTDLPAGRYLVTITNTTDVPSGGVFMQLPEGMSADDFKALFAPPEATSGSTSAESSPAAEGADIGPPPWYYEVYQAGGPAANPGQTVRGIVDLLPGQYVVWADDPSAPQVPVGLTVSGEMASPDPDAEPEASVTIREHNESDGFAFMVNGAFTAGTQKVKIVNESDQPHFVLLLKATDGLTQDQLELIVQNELTGATPSPGSELPDPDTFPQAAYVSIQSAGATQWMEIELATGTYVMLCFVGDPTKDSLPHVFEGMATLVEVS